MKSKLIYIVLIVLSMTFVAQASASTNPLSFKIDNNNYVTPSGEPEPYINKDGRTMVPIRFIGNALGVADVDIVWDSNTSTATITKNSKKILIKVGDHFIINNDQQVKMDTAAEITKERLFIPARFIAEALGARVEWDDKQNKVFILSTTNGNLSRYSETLEMKQLPVTLEDNKVKYSLKQVFIYPAGSDEFNTYFKSNKIFVEQDVNYLITTKFTVKNKNTDKITWQGGDSSMWFISEAHGSITTPLEHQLNSLDAGQEDEFNQAYTSTVTDIKQIIVYLEDGSDVKEVTLFQNHISN
jgi:hypothetical protein